jgi:signal recognition particle GTPase
VARYWSARSDTVKIARNARAAKGRRERVAEVRRWLSNYQELKKAIEAICELNHDLLRPERAASKAARKAA